MATNRLVSLNKSKINNLMIDAIQVETSTQLKTNTIDNYDGTAVISFSNNKLENVLNPVNDADVATKQYVDTAVEGAGGGGVNNPMTTNLDANNFNISNVNSLSVNGIGNPGNGNISVTNNMEHQGNNITNVNLLGVDNIEARTGNNIQIQNDLNLQTNTINNISSSSSSNGVVNKSYIDDADTTLQNAIVTNSLDIASNLSSITTNTGNIATNTANIATNTQNIGLNATQVVNNANNIGILQGRVTINEGDIATNQTNIGINTFDIATKTSINDGVNNSFTQTWSNSKIYSELLLAGNRDFVGLDGSVEKVNLNITSVQPKIGRIESYTALVNLSAGQPVLYNYGGTGAISVSNIGTLPAQQQIVGINLNDVSAGGTAQVLTNGFGTCRRTSVSLPSTNSVALTNTTNGTIGTLTNQTTFTDSGGTGGNYGSSQNYSITFDAGAGRTINFSITSLSFEHTNTRLYDRLGFQTSNDGVNYSNPNLTGFHTTNVTTPPFGSNYVNNGTRGNDTTGNVFPETTGVLEGAGGSLTQNTGARYLRFFFFSDSSAQEPGWNITLSPDTPYPVGAVPVPVATTMYIDSNDLTRVTETNTSQLPIGFVAYNNADNDSIFCRIHPAQHS